MTKVIGALTTTPDVGDPIVSPWYQQIATYARHIFTTKAALDSGWSNAPNGACAFTTSEGVAWDRIGGVWVDARKSQPFIQSGAAYPATDSGGLAVINFPVAFGAPPVGISLLNCEPTQKVVYCLQSVLAGGFYYFTYNSTTGGALANTATAVRWTAVGTRA